MKVVLCEVLVTDMKAREDTLGHLHDFETETAIPTGTVYRWKDRLFTHAYDMGKTIYYVEQRPIVDIA
jgi:hypothetical protein